MDDLDRLFRHLVSLLADQEPARLHAPFEVVELYQQILPYRQHRAALGLDTSQDYEMAILRLLAGDRGYATVEPSEVQQALRQEAEAVNPDTGAFREYAAARVRLSSAAVRAALDAREAYAPATPPVPADESRQIDGLRNAQPAVMRVVGGGRDAVGEAGRKSEAAVGGEVEGGSCPYCGQNLPTQRVVFYCPFCGGNVKGVECPKCGTGLEVGWTFCVTCGHKVGRG